MKIAPPREHEADVLAALRRLQVLDSEPEAEFDALVRAASVVCGAPISLISLVDAARQWFKANVGLPGVSETPRDLAFCAHAVLGDQLFEVPDAADDPRFADNPLVTDQPKIRFYAGAPIQLTSGECIGTLCVIDRQPRKLDATQREVLTCLAKAAATALEGRLARIHVQEEREQLASIVEGTQAGTWEHFPLTGKTCVNPYHTAMLGYAQDEPFGAKQLSWLDLIHPDDQAHAHQAWTDHLKGAIARFEAEFRMRHRDGHWVWLLSRGQVVARDSAGRATRVCGIQMDISELKAAREAASEAQHDLRTILDALPSQIGYWDRGLRNRMANQAYTKWFGVAPTSIRGKHMRELLGDAVFNASLPHLEAALRGEARSFEESMGGTGDDAPVRHSLVNYLPDVLNGEVRGIYTLVHDVTELVDSRTRLIAAQSENEALLSTLHHHTIVSVADCAGRIVDVNEAFCKISGFQRHELIGQDHRIIQSGRHDRAFWQDMWRTISSGQSWRGEVCNRAKDGSIYWVDSIVAPFLGADGLVEKYISICTDITARKHTEAALRDSNERFSIASESAGIGVWEFDAVTNDLRWDDRMYAMYGKTRTEQPLDYTTWAGSVHPDDRPRAQSELQAALRGERPFDTEFRIKLPSGEVRHIKGTGRVLRDAAGAPLRMTGVNIDVTDRVRAELVWRETSALLETVLASASEVSIIATDPQLNITVFNSGAERLLGYKREEVVNRTTPMLIHDADEVLVRSQQMTEQLGRPVDGPNVFIDPQAMYKPHEWTYIGKGGRRTPVSLVVTPMHDESGALYGYLGIAHDVSQQKQYEHTLRDARDKAERANLAKSLFLANMSHEIRTPMNAVIGLTYVMERTPLSTDQAALVRKIKVASKSLLNIINDILDLSKIEASELRIEQAPFDLAGLLRDLEELFSSQCDDKGIGFSIHTPNDLPTALEGDVTRLRQILTNLLANAVKFTSNGAVGLTVSTARSNAGTVWLRFVIRDSGIGIDSPALSRLFTPFAQADDSTTRRFGGTGLGLSIVKQLAALMGGEVGVTSEPQKGSEFWVQLPFTPTSLAPRDEALPADLIGQPCLTGVRVLVVDDSVINLEVARRILELQGATVSMAASGQDAVDALLRSPKGFDVVLMDIQMPQMDGYATTRRIRDGLNLRQLPIIALSAGAMMSERQQSAAAGMVDFVCKPFDPADLVSCIRRHVAVSTPALRQELAAPVVTAIPGWPKIEGIDSSDACTRLGGHLGLFTSMLTRLLDDFSNIQHESAPDQPDCAARMHRLKGSAGTLGAKALARLAAEAEDACRAGNHDAARSLIDQVSEQIAALRAHAEPVLQATQSSDTDTEAKPQAPLPPETLQALLKSLRENDLDALNLFASIAVPMRQMLGKERYSDMRRKVDNLQFGEAAEILAHITSP